MSQHRFRPFTNLLLALLILPLLCVGALPDGEFYGTRESVLKGKEYAFHITTSALRKAPKWNPDAPFPPLSPKEARAIATAQLRTILPEDYQSMEIQEIRLEALDGDAEWIYLVVFVFNDGRGWTGPRWLFTVPVYLDGSTITPKISVTKRSF